MLPRRRAGQSARKRAWDKSRGKGREPGIGAVRTGEAVDDTRLAGFCGARDFRVDFALREGFSAGDKTSTPSPPPKYRKQCEKLHYGRFSRMADFCPFCHRVVPFRPFRSARSCTTVVREVALPICFFWCSLRSLRQVLICSWDTRSHSLVGGLPSRSAKYVRR